MSTAKAPAAPSGRICEKYGKVTRQTASRQWNNGILLKTQRKTCVTMIQQYSITCIVLLYLSSTC